MPFVFQLSRMNHKTYTPQFKKLDEFHTHTDNLNCSWAHIEHALIVFVFIYCLIVTYILFLLLAAAFNLHLLLLFSIILFCSSLPRNKCRYVGVFIFSKSFKPIFFRDRKILCFFPSIR